MQCSAKHDIQLLKSSANTKQRYPLVQHSSRQRQRSGITMRIMHRTGLAGLATVMMRFNIRRASCQQNTVNLIEKIIVVNFFSQSRDHQRQRIGSIRQGLEVFLTNHMKWVGVDNSPVSRHANYGFRAHMGTNPISPVSWIRCEGYFRLPLCVHDPCTL